MVCRGDEGLAVLHSALQSFNGHAFQVFAWRSLTVTTSSVFHSSKTGLIRPSFHFDGSFDRLQGSKGRAATKVSLPARDFERAPSLDFEGRILQYIDDRDEP